MTDYKYLYERTLIDSLYEGFEKFSEALIALKHAGLNFDKFPALNDCIGEYGEYDCFQGFFGDLKADIVNITDISHPDFN